MQVLPTRRSRELIYNSSCLKYILLIVILFLQLTYKFHTPPNFLYRKHYRKPTSWLPSWWCTLGSPPRQWSCCSSWWGGPGRGLPYTAWPWHIMSCRGRQCRLGATSYPLQTYVSRKCINAFNVKSKERSDPLRSPVLPAQTQPWGCSWCCAPCQTSPCACQRYEAY